ncbi:MAG: TM0996/MTH895 family glutaredoxin-like protein [Candidatus Marinimicrobia bacterium]|nr:TM0996/MTH895 family glutaredoxin-like protein [Candidatus Neomarinimicrobiota bacterium]
MDIQVLGTGCVKCNQLMAQTQKAVKELKLGVTVTKVSDINEILAFGIMTIPALVVDNKVKLVGYVPALHELKEILKKG